MKNETRRAVLGEHADHKIIKDAWARDFGGRLLGGNAYCKDCGEPIEFTI